MVESKKLLKKWKLEVESNKVAEIYENQWLKPKKLLKNLKTVESKKVAEKIFQPAVESKKVAEISENQRLKAKKLLKNLKTVESKKVAEKS